MSKQKTIAVDLDGTLARYDGWRGIDHIGDPLPGAAEFVRRLRQLGRVMIYTTRCTSEVRGDDRGDPGELRDRIANWCNAHGIEFDEIWTGQGKPLYAALVDDRAVACRPQDDASAYDGALMEVRRLVTT